MLPISAEKPSRSDGNTEVIKMIEMLLEQARKGRMNYVAIVAAEGPFEVTHSLAGSLGLEFGINWGLDCLKQQLFKERESRQRPTNPNAKANEVCFNLMQMAPSFDFMNWLAIAEMRRRQAGAPAPLKVGFFFGRIKDSWKDDDRRPGMLENVCRPALAFVGAVEDESAVTGKTYDQFLLRSVKQAYDEDRLEIPEFRATKKGEAEASRFCNGRRPIVITLREANHWPHRNSNLPEWLKFADYLKDRGEVVVFVRDTAKADELIKGYNIYPNAARNLDLRLALYEQAKCSLFAANGPWNLAVFGRWPWLMFNEALEDDPFEFNRPEGWQLHNGINPGQQFPWQLPTQRIIWARDDFNVMRKVWEEYAPLLERQEAAE